MGARPSAIYDVTPKYVAFYFDRAVETFGRALEDAMAESAKGAKTDAAAQQAATRVADRWLSSADPITQVTRGRFRDPFAEQVKRA